MEKRAIPTVEKPKLYLLVQGDLNLKGWDEQEVVARSHNGEDLQVEQKEQEIHIRCQSHCTLRVPIQSSIEIQSVGGHASLKSLEGESLIRQVSGDLTLRGIGPVIIESVNGNLNAKNVTGDLRVGVVEGNASVRDIQGDFIVTESIQGNLALRDVDGDVRVSAQGSLNLNLDPSPGNTYVFESQGSLVCRLPADASAKLNIPRADSLTIRIPGVESPDRLQAPHQLTLGEGDAALSLAAEGSIMVIGLPGELDLEDLEVDLGVDFEQMAESLTQQVEYQVEAQMEMLEQQLEVQLSNLTSMLGKAGVSAEHAEHMAQRARQAGERAQARAQEKIQRAQEKLQRKLEAARRRAEVRARAAERAARDRRRRPEPIEWPAAAPELASAPVSEQERLMVLQMLEQKKITVEEAEQLLAALEVQAG
ncbi:MAG TPA: hypothetical protein VJ436_04695 [Anaerolineales bacterium]|nr:hypothetical protein [Anaerolineales bacterium]